LRTSIAVTTAIMLASLMSVAALWDASLQVQGVVRMGSYDPEITSTKLIISNQCQCNCTHGHGEGTIETDPANHLRIYIHVEHVHHNTTIWLGLIISNKGTTPFKITHVETNATNPETYVYGPYQAPGTSQVWSHATATTLPYPGYTRLPSPSLQAPQKLILWIKLEPAHSTTQCHKETYEITIETKPFNT